MEEYQTEIFNELVIVIGDLCLVKCVCIKEGHKHYLEGKDDIGNGIEDVVFLLSLG